MLQFLWAGSLEFFQYCEDSYSFRIVSSLHDGTIHLVEQCSIKLFGEWTRKWNSATISELQFADDFAAVTVSRRNMERAVCVLEETLRDWELAGSEHVKPK